MIESLLQEKISVAIRDLYGILVAPDSVTLEKTRKDFEGDYTLVVFPYLKVSRKTPEATAAEIGDCLMQEAGLLDGFGVIKGFLNLRIKDEFWISFLLKEYPNRSFGLSEPAGDPPVVVEFSSPNTNKPLHLGHIRNNLLGDSVSAILHANGRKVIRVNLVNDRGIHICKSMLAYALWGNGETPQSSGLKGDHLAGKYYVMFDQHYRSELKQMTAVGMSEEQAVSASPLMNQAREMLRKWEEGDPVTVALWRKMNSWVYEGFDETYHQLGIRFDKTYYESDTYLAGKQIVMEGLSAHRLIRKEDGSIWADLKEDGLDEKLLLRPDGTSVYMTQDLGTACQRFEEFRPGRMIYVVGNEQNYHFEVLKKILLRLGYGFASSLFHLSYGMVELPSGKMKSREGTVVDADDLISEMTATAEKMTRELGKAHEARDLFYMIGMGALKYFILKVDPKKNMLFDPSESIDFNGNTGPFIQYTHARIASLIRKAGEHCCGDNIPATDLQAVTLLPVERNILKQLYRFPSVIGEAGEMLSPALLANYLYELTREYNQFYQEVPILKGESCPLVSMRLRLSELCRHVIRTGMELLGIPVPDRM